MYNNYIPKYLIIRNYKSPNDEKTYIGFPDSNNHQSINNFECITDCKLPGRYVQHPLNKIKITDYSAPFCATEKWYNNIEKKFKYHDLCNLYNLNSHLLFDNNSMHWADIESNSFSGMSKTECKKILNIYYNIQCFKDLEIWSKKARVDPITKARIINCAYNNFKKDEKDYIKKLQNNKIEYFFNLCNSKWFIEIYNGLNELFPVDLTEDKVKSNIKNLILNKKIIKDILNKFIKNENYENRTYKLDWFQISDFEEDIKIYLIQYLRHYVSKNFD